MRTTLTRRRIQKSEVHPVVVDISGNGCRTPRKLESLSVLNERRRVIQMETRRITRERIGWGIFEVYNYDVLANSLEISTDVKVWRRNWDKWMS